MYTNTTTSVKATRPTQRQRKPKVKLSPVLEHELGVLRAARMGIDISYMAPDQRCKYPSKFCCNMRARKSTGKLHRLCEFHRSRAKVNQQRWIELRRKHELVEAMVEATLARDVSMHNNDRASAGKAVTDVYHCHSLPSVDREVRCMASVYQENAQTATEMSERDLDLLMAVLTRGERVSQNDPWSGVAFGDSFRR